MPYSRRQTASHGTTHAQLTVSSGLTQLSGDTITWRLEMQHDTPNAMRCRARHPNSGALNETNYELQRANLRVRTLEGADWRARKSSARRAPTTHEQRQSRHRARLPPLRVLGLQRCERVLNCQHDTEFTERWSHNSLLEQVCPSRAGQWQGFSNRLWCLPASQWLTVLRVLAQLRNSLHLLVFVY